MYCLYSDNQCEVGFSTLGQLQLATIFTIEDEQLRVIPDITFTCDGKITNWTMAAIMSTRWGERPVPSAPNMETFKRIDRV